MKERIKELAEQSGLAIPADVRSGYIYPEGMMKFAELIVRECAEVSFKHWEQHKGCSAHFSIREHFGVYIEYDGVEE
jgi:hypothetical protein